MRKALVHSHKSSIKDRKVQESTPPYSFIRFSAFVSISSSACLLRQPMVGKTTDPCCYMFPQYRSETFVITHLTYVMGEV
jgi:hypothetical protein